MSDVSRREVVRQLALAITAAGSGVFNLEAARVAHAVVSGEQQETGAYRARALTDHELVTVTRLAELIVPADTGGGSGADAGAPELIDLLCSENEELASLYHGGLAWLDAAMRRRVDQSFIEATAAEQTALLDRLVAAERTGEVGDLAPGVVFFDWIRRMTVDAYYTSPIGIADLGYQGNTTLTGFDVPTEAVDFVNRRIREL